MAGGSILRARRQARFDLLRVAPWLAVLALYGCAGHAAHTLEARKALDHHDAKKALELYNKQLEVESGGELPKDTGGDNAVFLLDRSMISQQLLAYEHSSQDLQTADKQVEMLDFNRSTADEIGRYLFSDDVGPYKARPFEKLLINTTNMVNYLARGNLQGAKVEARRLAVMQKYLSQVEDSPDAALLGPGSYLAGFVFEMAREQDEALRYYDEALKFAPYTTLQEPIRQVAQYSGYRSPRLKPIVEGGPPATPDPNSGELLVVVHYGRVPALKAERVPIGAALTVAGVFLAPAQNQAARRMAGQGLVTWVNYPSLEAAPRAYGAPVVQLDAKPMPLDTITDVDALVHAAYERAKGPIMASAVTRMITRAAVGAGAGTAAGRGSGNSALGMLVALGTQAAMTAVDTPDTRCWATLPARIAFARMRVAAGRHKLRIAVPGAVRDVEVDVRAGGFAVVNLTELSRY
jgi:tetratricopeptide (TPR) repeat protein